MLPTCTCSYGSFGGWMATAAVLSATTTFLLTRQYFSRLIARQSMPVMKQSSPASVVKTPEDDTLSYLCTNCGTEKSTPVAASASESPALARLNKGPVKMVILVRTDLNMVNLECSKSGLTIVVG